MKSDFFARSIEKIITEKSFEKKVASKKARIKIGLDPTRPDIHLGHAVSLLRLKKLQDVGNKVIIIIGDYTTKIGDPSGRNMTRPILTDKEIKENAKTYFDQVKKILDAKKTEVHFNSKWLSKLTFNDLLQIAGKFTVAQIIERDDFENRLKKGQDIALHEMLYPLMQGYDSVVIKSDIEVGGTDQMFNILAGRDLQRKMRQNPQDAVLFKILRGTDGKEKMSKSLDNYIGISEDPASMFGKIMSIPDNLIIEYFELCTELSKNEIDEIREGLKKGKNPRDIKLLLGRTIVKMYHGEKQAEEAESEFLNIYSKKEIPADIPEIKIKGSFSIISLLSQLDAISTNSEARRLIVQGGVKIDGAKITDPSVEIAVHDGMIVQVGKHRFYKIKI